MNSKGYTLLEVTLFMAISAALSLTAFIGLGPRLRNARFSDSVNNIESSFTKEMQAAQSGINQRDNLSGCKVGNWFGSVPSLTKDDLDKSDSGSSGSCVINGRLAVFLDDKVRYYSIVSLREKLNPTCEKVNDLSSVIACYRPQIVAKNNMTPKPVEKSYSNGVTASKTDSVTNPTGGFEKQVAFGYVRDPGTGTDYRFFHTEANESAGSIWWSQSPLSDNNTSQLGKRFTCLYLGNRNAKFSLSVESLKPVVEFDKGC